MKIAVVLRQVPDLIEPLEIADSQTALELEDASFLVNEYDDHALEQALLLKEATSGSVTAVALDFGEVDDTLYAAVAKGVDQVIKIPLDDETPPSIAAAAAMFAEVIKGLGTELVLVGSQAYDELEGSLAPLLALELSLPYAGVIRGVKPEGDGTVTAFKEYPGAVMSELKVALPALLGILTAEQPPRYVPVSRIRAAMKSAEFQEAEVAMATVPSGLTIERLYPPAAGERAEILEGSEDDVAARISEILAEKGLIK